MTLTISFSPANDCGCGALALNDVLSLYNTDPGVSRIRITLRVQHTFDIPLDIAKLYNVFSTCQCQDRSQSDHGCIAHWSCLRCSVCLFLMSITNALPSSSIVLSSDILALHLSKPSSTYVSPTPRQLRADHILQVYHLPEGPSIPEVLCRF